MFALLAMLISTVVPPWLLAWNRHLAVLAALRMFLAANAISCAQLRRLLQLLEGRELDRQAVVVSCWGRVADPHNLHSVSAAAHAERRCVMVQAALALERWPAQRGASPLPQKPCAQSIAHALACRFSHCSPGRSSWVPAAAWA